MKISVSFQSIIIPFARFFVTIIISMIRDYQVNTEYFAKLQIIFQKLDM